MSDDATDEGLRYEALELSEKLVESERKLGGVSNMPYAFGRFVEDAKRLEAERDELRALLAWVDEQDELIIVPEGEGRDIRSWYEAPSLGEGATFEAALRAAAGLDAPASAGP